jgi:hypothetical protein
MTRTQFLAALTLVNLGLLAYQLVQETRVSAQDVAPVLRGRALEIVDEQGRIRASITRYGGGPTYSDIVVFRLHDRQGKPMVKLDTHEAGPGATMKGSGLGLLGESDDTQAFIGTSAGMSKVDLKNGNGERRQFQP